MAVGGAVAESLYALLAFWGLSAVLARYPVILPASRVAGAGLLMVLGLVMLLARTRGATPRTQPGRRGGKRSFALGFLLIALNPTLIVTWTAAVAALNASGLLAMDQAQALPFASAACAGIVAWFLTLLWLVGKWRSRVSAESLGRFKRGMGAVLLAAGAWMALRALLGALRP